MDINNEIIREYDIRGIYNNTLTDRDAFNIGSALACILREKGLVGDVTICRDGRLSSPSLAKQLKDGIKSQGYNVIDLGVGPTPLLYYSNFVLDNISAGVMVTGSHNPADYNGFKFIVDKKPFYGKDIKDLADIIRSGQLKNPSGSGNELAHDLQKHYINFLLSKAAIGDKTTIIWDAGNGATGEVIKELCSSLAGNHIVLNDKIDGTFPSHHPDPTVEENLQQIISEVKKRDADFGIAFDGDGDRIGIVDNEGNIIWGDQILTILAQDVIERLGPVPIIADIKSSQKLFSKIEEYGGVPVMWKTGHSNIKTKMIEINAPLAGEMSGHIFYKDDYFGYDDAIFAAIKLISYHHRNPDCIKKVLEDYKNIVNTPEIRIQCPEDKKFLVIKQISDYLKKENYEFNDIDGVRMNTVTGWWLIRASNTQDVLVLRLESNSQKELSMLEEQVEGLLMKFGVDLKNKKVI